MHTVNIYLYISFFAGVEIVPEIDVPAHSASWGKAFPDIVIKCPVAVANRAREERKKNPNAGILSSPEDVYPLDPSSFLLKRILKATIKQIATV